MYTHDVNALKIIMAALTYIVKNHDKIRHNAGICGNIYSAIHALKMERAKADINTEMKNLFALWPKFSGNETYPIPGCGRRDPKQQFIYTGVNIDSYWDKSSRYGRLRWSLVYFMIRRARQLIKDIESSTNTDNGM